MFHYFQSNHRHLLFQQSSFQLILEIVIKIYFSEKSIFIDGPGVLGSVLGRLGPILNRAGANIRLVHGAGVDVQLVHGADSNVRLVHGADGDVRLLHLAGSDVQLVHVADSDVRDNKSYFRKCGKNRWQCWKVSCAKRNLQSFEDFASP